METKIRLTSPGGEGLKELMQVIESHRNDLIFKVEWVPPDETWPENQKMWVQIESKTDRELFIDGEIDFNDAEILGKSLLSMVKIARRHHSNLEQK